MFRFSSANVFIMHGFKFFVKMFGESLTLSKMTNFGLFPTPSLQTTILNLMEMVKSSPKGRQKWEKEKMLFNLLPLDAAF